MNVIVDSHSEAEWSAFNAAQPHAVFFQSWNWKRAQEAAGKIVHTVSVVDGAESSAAIDIGAHVSPHPSSGVRTLAQTLCIVEPLGFARYMVVSPRGPVFDAAVLQAPELMQMVMHLIAKELRHIVPGSVVWRCEPAIVSTTENAPYTQTIKQTQQILATALPGARQIADKQPAATRMLTLAPTTEELLGQMKQKTRYNIRLSEKKGVITQWFDRATTPTTEWQQLTRQWWALQQETAARQHIHTQPQQYFNALLNTEWPTKALTIGVARVGNQIAAININIAEGDTQTYVYGASSDANKEAMAPYALQWSAIQAAKSAGYTYYDFYGIAPGQATATHKLAGVTRFKEGFGGTTYQYPGTWEFPISRLWYTMYRFIQMLRS